MILYLSIIVLLVFIFRKGRNRSVIIKSVYDPKEIDNFCIQPKLKFKSTRKFSVDIDVNQIKKWHWLHHKPDAPLWIGICQLNSGMYIFFRAYKSQGDIFVTYFPSLSYKKIIYHMTDWEYDVYSGKSKSSKIY